MHRLVDMVSIKLKQYVYIAISSESLSNDEIESRIGIKADKHEVLGTKRHASDPSWPITNSWELVCDKNIPIHEQIEVLIKHLLPAKDALIELVNSQSVKVTLEIVRYFDHPDGEKWRFNKVGWPASIAGLGHQY